jgi:hypothetical protein
MNVDERGWIINMHTTDVKCVHSFVGNPQSRDHFGNLLADRKDSIQIKLTRSRSQCWAFMNTQLNFGFHKSEELAQQPDDLQLFKKYLRSWCQVTLTLVTEFPHEGPWDDAPAEEEKALKRHNLGRTSNHCTKLIILLKVYLEDR